MNDNCQALRKHVVNLLSGGGAHVDFKRAVAHLAAPLRRLRPPGAPHSAWELLEHMRIAQWDILEFSRNPKHKSPHWPDGYWPASPGPGDPAAWAESIKQFRTDLAAMQSLVKNPKTDLFAEIPHGDGQTILREALVLADHNAYHIGELVYLRHLLGAWP